MNLTRVVQLAFGVAVLLVTGACDPRKPPCDETKLRAVDTDYATAVATQCLRDYPDKESCPAWPALRDKHREDLRKVCPQ